MLASAGKLCKFQELRFLKPKLFYGKLDCMRLYYEILYPAYVSITESSFQNSCKKNCTSEKAAPTKVLESF
jgi:hypothetical protein